MADFFDKVKQTIDKGLATASVKSKEILDTTKLKREVGTFQKQRSALLEKLGNIVYAMFLRGSGFDEERIKETCGSIGRIDSQIKEKKEELEQIHLKALEALGIVVCDCGTEISKGVKFCSKCGKKVEEIAESVKGSSDNE
ncbi:MAG: zinc ribbon domain-containing protein [bacterium]|nr:zinc ribbon domain-containing protein [bacterium]